MTHVPPQFRMPRILIDEWRRRASQCRLHDPASADAYERCADELSELDVHTEAATDGTPLSGQRSVRIDALMPWLAAGATGIGVVGLMREMARRRRPLSKPLRPRIVARPDELTPPHGDKLRRQLPGGA